MESALAQPRLVWSDSVGPWSTGPSGTTNENLYDNTAVVNSFVLVDASQPMEIEWTAWGEGRYVALGGDSTPWGATRFELNGYGWLEEGSSSDPWDVVSATLLWNEWWVFGPPAEPDVSYEGAFGPIHTRFVAQPGVTYTLKQWNLSRLNFYDLGYCTGTVTSEVSLVPEQVLVKDTTWGMVKALYRD